MIDGEYGEWSLADDHFADLYRAGDPDKGVEAQLYLRYACESETLNALVLGEEGVQLLPRAGEAWLKLADHSGKLINGTSPDFAWVTVAGETIGWEASAVLLEGSYRFIAHLQVEDDGSQGASTDRSTKKDGIKLLIDCKYPPEANDDEAITDEDAAVRIDVLANDSDADDNLVASTAKVISAPEYGSVESSDDGSFEYLPDLDFSGFDRFSYEICDADELCDTADVSITVNPVNDSLLASDDAYSTHEDGTPGG